MNEHFLRFCFLNDLLMLHFLLDVSTFTTTDDEKEKKINSASLFEGFYLKMRRKFLKFTLSTLDNLNPQKLELHTTSEDILKIKLPLLLHFAQN